MQKEQPHKRRPSNLLDRFEGTSWSDLLDTAPALLDTPAEPYPDFDGRQKLDSAEDEAARAWESSLIDQVRAGTASIESVVAAVALHAAHRARHQWIRSTDPRTPEFVRAERRAAERPKQRGGWTAPATEYTEQVGGATITRRRT